MRALIAGLATFVGLACAGGVTGSPPEPIGAYPVPDLSACGADLSSAEAAPVDAVIVLDVSASTGNSSDSDIDGDGEIHALGSDVQLLISSGSPDSFLAAQVVAVRSIVAAAGPGVRLGLVETGIPGRDSRRTPEARLVAPLGADLVSLESGLASILAEHASGRSTFAKGMRVAIEELYRSAGARRIVLFIADDHAPIIEVRAKGVLRGDPDAKDAVLEARRLGIVFHTFGLREAVEHEPPHLLSRIAKETGGRYTAVRSTGRLHCALVEALVADSP